MAVAKESRRLLDCRAGANLFECSSTHHRNPGNCCFQEQQQDRPAIGKGKGGHSRSVPAGCRRLRRNSPVWDDPIAQRSRLRCHYDLGADAQDEVGNAGRAEESTAAEVVVFFHLTIKDLFRISFVDLFLDSNWINSQFCSREICLVELIKDIFYDVPVIIVDTKCIPGIFFCWTIRLFCSTIQP